MISVLDASSVTAAGNAVFVVVSILGLVVMLFPPAPRTRWAKMALLGVCLILTAIIIRIGMWLLAIWTRVPPDHYGEWVQHVRDETTIVAALIYALGCGIFAAGVMRHCPPCWAAIAVALGLASAALGYWLTPV